MNDTSTIQVQRSLLAILARMKQHPRQSYNEVIANLVKENGAASGNYDRYLHEIQKPKMKELWGSKQDEAWDNV